MPDTSLIESFKGKLPTGKGVMSAAISALFFFGTLLVNVTSKNTHIADVQAQQEKRIADLESTVHGELVTKDAVQQLQKSEDQRFDDLKDQIKAYHDEEMRFHHGAHN